MKLTNFRLLRPFAWFIFLLPFSMGFAWGTSIAAIKCNISHIFFAFISFCCTFCFCFIFNMLADKDVDKLHDGKLKDINIALNPLITGEITEEKTILLGIIFFFLSLLSAWQVNPFFFLFFFFITMFGYCYSMPPLRFKAKPIADIICNSFSAAFLFYAGITICGINLFSNESAVKLLFDFFIIVLYASFFYIPSVIADYIFDKKAGLQTSAVFFGPKKLLLAMYPLCILLTIYGFYKIITNNEHFFFNLFFYVSINSIIICTTFLSNIRFKQNRLLIEAKWIIILFLLISVGLIIYAAVKF
jgi:4-hydroxybenzoate polyprenyltransferase